MHLAVKQGCGQRAECGVAWITAWWSTAEEFYASLPAADERPDGPEDAEHEQNGETASLR